MIPVLLDSAIGDNIDDAFAIALACNSPQINLLGVTTVGTEGPKRALLAKRLMSAYGKSEIPVAPGDTPPHNPFNTPRFSQHGLVFSGEFVPDTRYPTAMDLMVEIIQNNPGLTLVATGPLTNIAALLDKYPDLTGKIGRLVFMGGWPSQGLPDSNTSEDPKATLKVFQTKIPITMVGYEVTLGCALHPHHLRQLESAPGDGPRYLRMMWQDWARRAHSRQPVMYDPLTIALLEQPDLVKTRKMPLSVSVESPVGLGFIKTDTATGREVDVCTDIRTESYLQVLISRVAPQPIVDPELLWNSSKFRVELKEAYQVNHFPGWKYRRTRQADSVLVVITSGDCTVTSDKVTIHASTGSMLFLGGRQAFDLCSHDGMSAYWFRFALEGFHPHPSTPRPVIDPHVKLQASMIQSTVTTAKQLLEHWRQPGVASSFHCQAGIFQLLGDYLEIYLEGRETTRGSQESLCIRVKRFIEGRLSESITLDDIGRHIGLTPTHIQKVFKDVMGVTPHQYQTHLRMYQAKQLLSLQDVTLKEIAVKVGFKSTEAFSRAFRREVGCSPGKYRGQVGGGESGVAVPLYLHFR